MSFESELRAHLGHSSITAYVEDRIYPVVRPQSSTLPALVYTPFGVDQVNNLAGRDSSLRFIRVQVDCWSRTFDEALVLAEAVKARMDTAASNFRTVLSPGSGFDDFEDDTRLYRRSMDFHCSFTQT